MNFYGKSCIVFLSKKFVVCENKKRAKEIIYLYRFFRCYLYVFKREFVVFSVRDATRGKAMLTHALSLVAQGFEPLAA